MTQDSPKHTTSGKEPGQRIDKDPPLPSTLPEERDNPGLNAEGTGGAGAPKPRPGERTDDRQVGDRLKTP